MFLLCTTTDSSGNFNYAVVEITPPYAQRLLDQYQPLWEQVHKVDNSLYSLEFFDSSPVWGDSTIDNLDEELLAMEDWLEAKTKTVVKGRLTTAAKFLQVTQYGVLWSASPKEGDGYFETRELSWEHLTQIAAGGRPFAAAGGRKEPECS